MFFWKSGFSGAIKEGKRKKNKSMMAADEEKFNLRDKIPYFFLMPKDRMKHAIIKNTESKESKSGKAVCFNAREKSKNKSSINLRNKTKVFTIKLNLITMINAEVRKTRCHIFILLRISLVCL